MKYLVDYQGMVNTFLKGRFVVQQTFLPIGSLRRDCLQPVQARRRQGEVAAGRGRLSQRLRAHGSTWRAPRRGSISPSRCSRPWAQAGIKVNIVSADAKQVLGIYRGRKHQMVLISWTPDYLDPHSNADTFAHNDDDFDGAKSHPLAWRNHWYIPDISKMKAAAQEVDTDKRKAAYGALQKEGDRRGALHPDVPAGQSGCLARQRDGLQGRPDRGHDVLSSDREALRRRDAAGVPLLRSPSPACGRGPG